MNNNARENDIRRAHLLFLMINAVFSTLLIIRILRPPVWELWFIPVILIMIVGIWIIYFNNLFSLRARTLAIAGASLVFLYFYGTHPEVLYYEFPLCLGFFTTACTALDEHILTTGGIGGYFVILFYHVIAQRDVSLISKNYLAIVVMLTVFFYSKFLIGKHSRELRFFDESIEHIEEERRSREDFLANVSHELRTPVNAITGMADILLKRDFDKEVREEILAIERAGYRLSNQIDDILDFSEIISGSLTDESESYFFSSLVRDLKDVHTGISDEKNTAIIWDIDSKIPSVLIGDKKKIRRVFSNIFRNALACQSGGRVYVSISSRKEEYGVNLSISVRDEGPGIKQEDIDRAYYGRFEGSNLNNRQEGLKLGLAISNGLARFMNGFIMFKADPGMGTTVTITIPQKVMDNEYWKEEGLNIENESDTLDLSGYRILVVDDDYMNLNVAKKMMSAYGGDIKTVDSGFSALELCKGEEFDLIFMDHMMPGMDGIETFKSIKSHPASKNKETVFIALTANAVSGAREMFLSEGFSGFISKPIDRKELERIVHRIIKYNYSKSETRIVTNEEIKPLDEPKEPAATEEISNIEKSADQVMAVNTKNPAVEINAEKSDDAEKPENTVSEATPGSSDDSKLDILKDYGVNTEAALNYCAGSMDFYMMVLTDFGNQIEDKITELSGYMESSDEENYRIKIHALKSNTKTLGFDDISEMARLSEMACKEDRFKEAKDSHAGIMERLREIETLINRIK